MSQAAPVANVERLHALMDAAGLDAVALRSGINVTWLAGFAYPGTLARHLDLADSVRAVMLLWPRRGEPVLVCDPAAAPVTRRDGWFRRIEVYAPYAESACARLCAVLSDAGLAGARVGFEQDALSAADWARVQRALPRLQMVDCAQLLERARAIKTPAEIERFRRGADLLDDAFAEVFAAMRAGDTEREVHSRLIASCLRRGAGWAHGILNTSRNPVLYGGEGDMAFLRGDIVRTDYVAYVDGYPGHQSRMAVVGPPSAEQRSQYALTRAIHMGVIDRCRPGALASDIYAWVVKEYAAHGVTYTASLVGHSVGPWFHQQEPILAPTRPVPLEEGMVLAIEPYRDCWHIQDLIVVRAAGPELLSTRFKTEELAVVG